MNDLTDDDLIALHRDGDPEAFEVIFDRYQGPVFGFARHLLGEHDGAQEVLQETFLAVARAAERYEGRGRFRAWIMRIARNRCLHRLAAERARQQALARGGLHPWRPVPAPPEQVAVDEELALVQQGLRRLPERQREALVLYAFEQMTYGEIAEVLELPPGTVKTLIHRGRARLARSLEQQETET
jgi:RNA polymerase sigma-70 factor (ECF subfamily)